MNRTVTIAFLAGVGIMAGARMIAQAPPAEHTTTITLEKAAVVPEGQQPAPEQLDKLFDLMRLRDQMDSITKMMPTMIQQQVEAQSKALNEKLMPGVKLNAQEQEASRRITQKYLEKALNIYPVTEIIQDMKALYQRHLTRDDVDGLIAFYSTPPAQHLLDAQPAIMQEYMPMVMKKVEERSLQLNEELAQELKELVKSAAPAASGKH